MNVRPELITIATGNRATIAVAVTLNLAYLALLLYAEWDEVVHEYDLRNSVELDLVLLSVPTVSLIALLWRRP